MKATKTDITGIALLFIMAIFGFAFPEAAKFILVGIAILAAWEVWRKE